MPEVLGAKQRPTHGVQGILPPQSHAEQRTCSFYHIYVNKVGSQNSHMKVIESHTIVTIK